MSGTVFCPGTLWSEISYDTLNMEYTPDLTRDSIVYLWALSVLESFICNRVGHLLIARIRPVRYNRSVSC